MKRTSSLKVILTVVLDIAFVKLDYLVEFLEFVTNTEGGGLEASPSGILLAADVAAKTLKEQLPFLIELDTSNLTEESWKSWIAEAINKYGEFHKVEQMDQPFLATAADAVAYALRNFGN